MADTYKRPNLADNIKRILTLPCHFDGAAYVELAAEAFIDFGVAVAEPDPKEIYHHITGEPLVHSIRSSIDELGEATGQEKSVSRRYLGKLLGGIDREIWWMFLLSAGLDALYDSTSNFIRMSPCLSGKGLGSGTAWVSAIPDNGRWQSQDFQFPEGSPFAPVSPAIVPLNKFNDWSGTVAASAQFVTFDSQPVGATCRLLEINSEVPDGATRDFDSNQNDDGTRHQEYTHVWYQVPTSDRGPDGILACQWSYTGDPLPLREAFLAKTSTCYLAGK